MYDYDMNESFLDEFDDNYDESFIEACTNNDFDDLFVEDANGDFMYVGDVYTEAFGKKKKAALSLNGMKKAAAKKVSKIPPVAKVTAEVAAVLAIAAGSIAVIKKIMRAKLDTSKGQDFSDTIEDIKEKMKALKKEHKEYIKSNKNMEKELKKLVSANNRADYSKSMKEQRHELNVLRMKQFSAQKFSVIKALCASLRKIGNKIYKKAQALSIPVPWGDKLNNKGEKEVAESAFIESVVNSFLTECAEEMYDEDEYIESYDDDLYESVLNDVLGDIYDDADTYEESYDDYYEDEDLF